MPSVCLHCQDAECLTGCPTGAIARFSEGRPGGAPPGDWGRFVVSPFAGTSGGALIVAGGANFPGAMPWDGGQKVWYDSIFVLSKPQGHWLTGFELPHEIAYGVSVSTPEGVLCAGGSDAHQHFRGSVEGRCRSGLARRRANRGGLGNMGGEYFQRLAGISMQHVPYRGGGPAVADVIAGHVPAIFLPLTTVGEHVRSGALVALAVTSKARVPVLPAVPTFAESGYPELVMASWFGLSGPKRLSPDITDRINREARAFLKEPQMRKLAENDASEPLDADAAGFTRYVAVEVARWGEVVRALDIKGEE